ncbi:hypothetical protein SLEP1_g44776 [Rubroshorea leprosula]|uniref:Uncharacterized protein n=1 Tax=Rubroshorea leprosula TaxID=152421 RepID=A0AAV5LHB7_9ROSI|nr:hypothetical protein SLEP1_g44776 [Rubroshorea leprosula]
MVVFRAYFIFDVLVWDYCLGQPDSALLLLLPVAAQPKKKKKKKSASRGQW